MAAAKIFIWATDLAPSISYTEHYPPVAGDTSYGKDSGGSVTWQAFALDSSNKLVPAGTATGSAVYSYTGVGNVAVTSTSTASSIRTACETAAKTAFNSPLAVIGWVVDSTGLL